MPAEEPVAPEVPLPPAVESCGVVEPLFAARGASSVTAPFGFTEAPACVPAEGAGTRFAHACREDQFTGCGVWLHTQLFDAEGRPLRAFTPEGDAVVETRRHYEAGRPVRVETLGGSGYRLAEATFSPAGEELSWRERWRTQTGDHCTEATRETTLTDWGAPAVTVYDGEERMTYAYDPQRRLIGVEGYLGTRALAYDEAGWLAWERDTGWFHATETWFDPQGRPTHVSQGGMGGTADEDLTYGPYGVKTRRYQWDGGSRGATRTEIVYDADGNPVLEWHTTDGELHVGGGEVTLAHQRIAIRRTFSCVGDVLLEEIDRDQDGVPDARTEYARDAAGNLLGVSEWEGARRTRYVQYGYACD